ncbi:hypothetical protein EWH99_05555 [Sporolactobacillus sp. THM7-7]|nr:hypothetical protein EWH99_05555 [Sporolactobacillus sp. THM7-7]
MNDWIKKGFLIGLGATVASKEKADKILNDLSKSGSAAAEETQSYLNTLSDKGKYKKEQWQSELKEEIKEAIQELGFVSLNEYNTLKARVDALEARLYKNEQTGENETNTEK